MGDKAKVTTIVLFLLNFIVWIMLADDPPAKYLIIILLLVFIWNTFTPRNFYRTNIILSSLLVVMLALLTSQFMAPTIGNVFEYGPSLDEFNMSCIYTNCPNCWELNFDTSWCSDCIFECSNWLNQAWIQVKSISLSSKPLADGLEVDAACIASSPKWN